MSLATSKYFVDRSGCSKHTIFPGVHIFTAAGEQMMLSFVEFQPHAVVAEHSHPHEQMGLMLEGEAEFFVGDEQQWITAGMMWRIPGGIKHRVVAGTKGCKALDVFHPIRDDYR